MRRAVDLPRLSQWLAFTLPAAGVCIFGLIAPHWYHRYRLSPIDGLIVGAFLGHLSWSVAWCALGPGRWFYRYLVVVSAGIAIAGALMAGIDLKRETHAERARAAMARAGGQEFSPRERARHDVWRLGLALPLALLAGQAPLVWNRFYRGWRIVFPGTESQSPETELLKFGVSDLLGATAGAAVAIGARRLEISELSRDLRGTEETLLATVVCIFLSLFAGVVLLPIVPLVLADRPRPIALASAAAAAGGIAIALTVAVFWLNAPLRRFGSAAAVFAYLAAVVSSTFGVFCIGRELRYRFIRTRRRGVFERWSVGQRVWRLFGKANQFNRALFSWSAIGCTAIAGACTLLWVVSFCTAKADLGFMYGAADEVTVAGGTITVNTILSVRNARSAWAGSSKPSRWMAPGLEIVHLEDYGGRTWLTVKCSLLIPGLTAAILAAFFHRFRQPRQSERRYLKLRANP